MENQNQKNNVVKQVEQESKKQQVVSVNKRIGRYLLICVNYNKGEDKIGLAVLDYKTKLSNGHLDVMMMEHPVLQFWVDATPLLENLVKLPFMSEVYFVVSGEGQYVKLHKVLTKQEYDGFRSMLG